jgi:hypothetical protein
VPAESRPPRRHRRRAGIALETLLLLPVVLLVALAVIEFSLVLGARERLLVASREGARVAALGGDERAVDEAVRRHLGDGAFQDAKIDMLLKDPQTHQPLHTGDPVGVWVSLPAREAAPDPLGFFGDETLVAGTVMRKE